MEQSYRFSYKTKRLHVIGGKQPIFQTDIEWRMSGMYIRIRKYKEFEARNA